MSKYNKQPEKMLTIRRLPISIAVICVLTSISIYKYLTPSKQIELADIEADSPVQESKSDPFSRLRAVSTQHDNQIINAPLSELVDAEYSHLSEREKELSGNVIKFDQLKYSINRREARKKLLAQVLNDPEQFELANNALLNLDETVTKYPQRHAEMRIFAIDLLKEKAIEGDDSALISALSSVSRELQSKSKWSKGRDQDLIDLLGAWIEAKGAAAILENPSELFDVAHYTPKLREVYFTALRLYLKNGTNDDSVDEIFMKYSNENA